MAIVSIVTFAAVPGLVQAANVSLADAVNCADFKHNPDGSWYAKYASLNYDGPDGKKTQTNFFDAKITAQNGEIYTVLNNKCGASH